MTVLKEGRARPGRLDWEFEIDGRTFELFLEVDADVVPYELAGLPAAIPAAMSMGEPLRVGGPLDPLFAANIGRVQSWFAYWFPTWEVYLRHPRPVAIEAETAPPGARPAGDAVGAFFSGGLDSFQLALDAPDVTHLIRINGFDTLAIDGRLEDRLSAAAARMGKQLIHVRTNLRQVLFEYSSWMGAYGAALAVVAHALAPMFRRVYVASGDPDVSNRASGSNADLDHLWSLEGLEIRRFGGEYSRAEKLLRVAEHEAACDSLRVCINDVFPDNCGRCFKCARMMLMMEVLGIRERFRTFPPVLDLDGIVDPHPEPFFVEDALTEELERQIERTPPGDLKEAYDLLLTGKRLQRRRGTVELERRPQPATFTAVIGDDGDLAESDALLTILGATRRQDERTQIDVVVVGTDDEGELAIPPRARSVAALGRLDAAELRRLARESDLILFAGWEAAAEAHRFTVGEHAILAGDLPPGAPPDAALYLVFSAELATTLQRLAVPANAIQVVQPAPAEWPRSRVATAELVRAKATRPAGAARTVVAADRAAADALRAARPNGFVVVEVGGEPDAAARGQALAAADAVLALGRTPAVPILLSEAMAHGCVVVATDAAAGGLIRDGRDGLVVAAEPGPQARALRALELLAEIDASPTGCRSIRAGAVEAALGRSWYPTARSLIEVYPRASRPRPRAARAGVPATVVG